MSAPYEHQLIIPGEFVSHSGLRLPFKINCDALSDAEITAIADVMAKTLPAFSSVEGVPTGGLRLASALRPFASEDGPVLIVDDVCTTGASLEAQRDGRKAIGVVIFNRGGLPRWCSALFEVRAYKEASR